ncbi:MAG: aldo/keto reductase [Chitinivibrionales bacterium]|nr:aldo/keto reductase [Chitinivibrionales bacterium]
MPQAYICLSQRTIGRRTGLMRQVTLGKTGLTVSALGFGGIPIQRLTDEQAVAVVRAALDLGVTFIDTATGYSDSQAKIGKALDGYARDRIVIASKSGDATKAGILRDIERGLEAMQTDYIDLYQLHGVSTIGKWEQCRATGGALEGLLEARERGMIRHIGFSSHSLDTALTLIEEPVFETVQFPFNLVTREPAERLIPRCRELNLGFIVMKPLCGGQYHDADLAFRFLNGFPDIVPIPGIERREEIEQIAALVESGETLHGEHRRRAEEIAESLGKRFCRRCGYCEPCPEGVPIQQCMIFDSFVARFPPGKLAAGPAKRVAEDAPKCIECGVCESKCPYELPIMQSVKEALAKAQSIVGK